MQLELSQLIDLAAHIILIIALIYILQEVVPNSKLLNRIYPPFSISVFRFLIGAASVLCFFDAMDKRESGFVGAIFNLTISIISVFVCYYSPILEHILEENFKEKISKNISIPDRIKSMFKKRQVPEASK